MIRASACNAWAAGVDGIYVCQWYQMWPYDTNPVFYERLRELPYPEVCRRARSHCQLAPPLIRFIPGLLTVWVPLFLKR